MRSIAYGSTLLMRRDVLAYRDDALANWTLPGGIEEVKTALLTKLRIALDCARSSNAYYAQLFASVGFDTHKMTSFEDMGVLAVTTKGDIREHQSDFEVCASVCPHQVEMATGGSTGQSLKFSMSRDDQLRSVGVQMAGWHLAGYVLGDRFAIFAGASIAKRDVVPWRVSRSDLVLNRRQFSAADLDDERIAQYWDYIQRWRPAYLRGYPTAIAELCRHRPAGRSRPYRPQAVLTTSEMLIPSDRRIIEETLEAPVFDGWGLNDGGAAAYECRQHAGMHVDTTRSYVEIVDEKGQPVWGTPGRVVVTSLTNKAFPFVRYDTGDMGVLEWRNCQCGRTGLMLMQILGRSNDTLKLGDVRISPTSVTCFLLGPLEHLRRHHVVQDAPLHITVTLDVEEGFDKRAAEEAVTLGFTSRCPAVSITFVYAPLPLPTDGSKWQSVVVLDSARRQACDPH